MMRKPALLVVAILLLVGGMWWLRSVQQPHPQFAPSLGDAPPPAAAPPRATPASRDGLPPFLPAEARPVIVLIQRGGPFPFPQDGSVFSNREGHLPQRPRGYYHEYTVQTPGLSHRGTRRIVTGGEPVQIWYYSDDHYDSFRSFSVPAQAQP